MKIGENTEFKLDLKTIISIVVFTSTIMGMYYTLESDIAGANNAGIKCVWVNRDKKKNTTDLQIDYEISSLSELLEFL